MGFWGKRSTPLQPSDPLLYELVELRRQQFDGLIWQVPALTFAGQAFLYSVLLGADTEPWARGVTGIVSIGISYLSLMLLSRHRQAEEFASRWLHEYEKRHGWPKADHQHGGEWAKARNKLIPGVENPGPKRRLGFGGVPLVNGYKTWVVALYVLIAITAGSTALGILSDYGVLDISAPTDQAGTTRNQHEISGVEPSPMPGGLDPGSAPHGAT